MAGYGTDQGFNDWLAVSGYGLPVGAPSPAVLRQRGSAYLDATYGARFAGVPTDFNQGLAWPRVGALVNGTIIPSDVIPASIEIASYIAAFQEATKPGSLAAVASPAGAVKRKKVASIEIEYQDSSTDGSAVGITPLISTVDGLLGPYLVSTAAARFGLWAIGC